MSRKVIVRRKRNPSTRQMDCRLHRPRMGRSRKLLARRTRLARSQPWNLVDCRRSGEDVSILQAPSRQQDYRRGLGYDEIGVSVSRKATMGTTCRMAQIDQTATDIIKIIVNGGAGNYVMCLRENKEMELYDRTNGRVLWVSKLP